MEFLDCWIWIVLPVFAGFLSGTSFDLLRNRNSVTGSLASQTNVPPLGSRPLHGSSILSESAKGITSNRPLSPNLILKKPQLKATYSISHRIFGFALGTAILISPILMNFSVVYDAWRHESQFVFETHGLMNNEWGQCFLWCFWPSALQYTTSLWTE